MNLSSLIELALKSEEVVELLEHYEIPVVYDFDRLNENTPDIYWASSPKDGFELRFNEEQVLVAIFMHVVPDGTFSAIDPNLVGAPLYGTFTEAKTAFETDGITFRTSADGEGWIKGNFKDYSVHYQFGPSGALCLVTVGVADAFHARA